MIRRELMTFAIAALLIVSAIWPFASLAVSLAGLMVLVVGALMVNARFGSAYVRGERYGSNDHSG